MSIESRGGHLIAIMDPIIVPTVPTIPTRPSPSSTNQGTNREHSMSIESRGGNRRDSMSQASIGRLKSAGLRRGTNDDPAIKIVQRHAEGLKKVDFLSDQIDRLSVSVEQRKVKLATIKNFNETLDDELFELSQQTGSALSGKGLDDAQNTVNRTLQTMLYKLETNLQKMNVAVDSEQSEQTQIKASINEYRQKKTALTKVNNKLEYKLHHTKEDLTDRLHDLQQAQEERLHTESHILALKQMLEGVDHTFATEWSSLTARLNKERHDIEDVQRRSAAASQARNWEEEVGKGGSVLNAVILHEKKQQTLKTRAKNVQWEAAKQRMSYRQAQAQLDEYRESLALLNKRLNIHTADDLFNRFERMENSNFEKLKQINALISETENLELKKHGLQEGIAALQTKQQQNKMHLIKEQEQLDTQEQKLKKCIELVNHRLLSVTTIVHQIMAGVEQIYADLECSSMVESAAEGMVLGGTTLTPLNLMLYLGILQQRTNNVLLLAKKKKRALNLNNYTQELLGRALAQEMERKDATQQRPPKGEEEETQEEGEETPANDKADKRNRTVPFEMGKENQMENNTITAAARRSSLALKKALERSAKDREDEDSLLESLSSLSVAGPDSPVRDLYNRTLRVNLNQLSKRLERLDQVGGASVAGSGGGRGRRRSPSPSSGRRSPSPSSGRRSPSPSSGRRSPSGGNEQREHRELPRSRSRSPNRMRRRSSSRLSEMSHNVGSPLAREEDADVLPLSRDVLMSSMRGVLM